VGKKVRHREKEKEKKKRIGAGGTPKKVGFSTPMSEF
jgi:hypothetical protein